MLSVQNVTFRYDEGAKPALDGITLDVQKGEYVAILGANGCGKSTLAKHFNAILLPESGRVLVEGMPTSDEKNLLALRQKVGMVFQNPDNQIVATVVEEDVAFAAENLGVEPHEMRRRVDEAMQLAGIYAYKDKAPHKLSGGQSSAWPLRACLPCSRIALFWTRPPPCWTPLAASRCCARCTA